MVGRAARCWKRSVFSRWLASSSGAFSGLPGGVDRLEGRAAAKLAAKATDERLRAWWSRNGSGGRSSYIWRTTTLNLIALCIVWFVLGLLFGRVALPGFVLLYWPWRRAVHAWTANLAECQTRGIAEPVAGVPVASTTVAGFSGENFTSTPQDLYFIHAQEETQGPYTREQLKSMWTAGSLTADALYWQDAAQAWCSLRELLEPPSVKPAPPPSSVAPARQKWAWQEWTVVVVLSGIVLLMLAAALANSSTTSSPSDYPPATIATPVPPAIATPFPSVTAAPNDPAENVKTYTAFAVALYPDIRSTSAPIHQATDDIIRELNQHDQAKLTLDESPLIVALLAAKRAGVRHIVFGDPTAPVGSALQILAINKPNGDSSHDSIFAFYGLNADGTGWEYYRQNAVNVARNRTFSFYVDRESHRAGVIVVDNHLQTAADGAAADNLLSLPNLVE